MPLSKHEHIRILRQQILENCEEMLRVSTANNLFASDKHAIMNSLDSRLYVLIRRKKLLESK